MAQLWPRSAIMSEPIKEDPHEEEPHEENDDKTLRARSATAQHNHALVEG
jgi:hypothetical protein